MSSPAQLRSPMPVDPDLPRYESLVGMLRATVAACPERTAIVYEDRRFAYGELGRAVTGLARWLEARRGRGGRVIILMRNSIEMDVALFAAMAAGAQAAPINPFFTVAELGRILPDVEADVILTDIATADKAIEAKAALGIEYSLVLGTGGDLDVVTLAADPGLDDAAGAEPAADDPALLIFTGGSTGIPKGVDLTHSALFWSVLQHVSVWPLEFGKETFLNVAPMFHIWGFGYATLVPIYSGGTLVMIPKYDPDEVVRALSDHRVTVFAGGPAPIYLGLLASEEFAHADLSALRYCPSGGAPCPEELHKEWLARVGQPLLEGWGMSEGAPFCLNRYHDPAGRRMRSVGLPVPETEVAIVDVETGERILGRGEHGEVKVRGPQLMIGYRHKPDETAATLRDGWVHTGDIGYIDDDGFVFLVDRKKDMIIVGGYNVYPREIDDVLYQHPKIREAATVGRPDERLGEVLVAFVVRAPGEPLTEDELFAWCKEAMVKYKRPVDVYFVDSLPKTRTNKLDRPALRAQLARLREGG